jgi:hypothetical protein
VHKYLKIFKEFVEAAEAEACSCGRPKLLVVAAVSASISRANNSYDIATIAKYPSKYFN